jgi:hypothetical protein
MPADAATKLGIADALRDGRFALTPLSRGA